MIKNAVSLSSLFALFSTPWATSLAAILLANAGPAAQTPSEREIRISPDVSIILSPAVVVDVSAPGEQRWGVHQFPALSRLPDGSILIMYSDARDASETHGAEAPAFVSQDEGETWQTYRGELQILRPHFSISEVFNNEFLVAASQPYLNVEKENLSLPEPITEADVYGRRFNYDLEEFPSNIRQRFSTLSGHRYRPQTGQWREETIRYDARDRVVVRREGSALLPQTFFERSVVRHKKELFYADYRAQYRMDGGIAGKKGVASLMVSSDNGRSFQRRATIAGDPAGNDLKGEPCLAVTADDRLVCVLRQSDQVQKPMQITWSSDRGHTWTPVKDLFEFGVFPCLTLVGAETLVLSYGRPGVWLSVAVDGRGENWADPVPIIEGNSDAVSKASCGYTSQLALDEDSLLLAYSDFQYPHPDGGTGKAIIVRRIQIVRSESVQ